MTLFKFQPFAIDKTKFGEEYNRHCALVPNDDDWILILDYDCMILTPETYQVIERAIERYPDTALFGGYTNRVGYSYQMLQPSLNEDADIKKHIQIAKDMADQYWDGECKDVNSLAGFFMLFRKAYWNQVKFPPTIMDRTGNLFDFKFCLPAFQRGLKIRLIKGVYVWHSYRILQEDHRVKDHLKI